MYIHIDTYIDISTLKDTYHALGWIVPPDFKHISANVHYLVEAATSPSGPFSR
jgi:hypothetical protein